MGCAAFAMEIFAQETVMESWSDEQKAWARSIPGWIYIVYALAVSTGVLGSVGLLLRKDWAILLFAVSLPAIILQMVYTMFVAGGLDVMGPSALGMPVVVTLLAAGLLWFSWFAKGRGWFGGAAPATAPE